MGKAAKGSRKGKKAWRANISADDIGDYFEKETKDALSGAKTLTSAPSESLFYVDKSSNIPPKRKIEKHREKVLHYESLLQKNAFVQPVPSSTLKKSRKKKEAPELKSITQNTLKEEEHATSAPLDLWDDKGDGKGKARKKSVTSNIPAVEVEPPGCSFNPSFEAHQDSLAQAVAVEMQKIYQKELGPQPVPLIVPGELMDEEDKYFLDADDGNENDLKEDLHNCSDDLTTKRPLKTKRVTRVEQNRRTRRKERLRVEAESKKMESISKEIDSIPDIMKEIAEEDEEKHKRRVRRTVTKQDRFKAGPPRLGKHKFRPAQVQVLLTEEISGSLRKLKGCCTLTRDRYKSLEKRGIVVPRANSSRMM